MEGRSRLRKNKICYSGAATVLALAGFAIAMAQTPGLSPTSPARAGIVIPGIVECGEGYTSHELYDMKITVLKVFRGEEAWRLLKAASPSNRPVAASKEYVIAHVKFEYNARGSPGLCVHQIVPEQFTALSTDGIEYETPSVVPPKPEMRKAIKSGEIFEGWVAFVVAKQDKNPLMAYSADIGGAIMHGGVKWFQLY
jgi:hypothetical protein